MSSREIAELVEARHDNVKRSMTRLQERGLITFTPMAEKSTGGRPAVLFHVNQRDSYVIVAQLSPEFTARLVDRWQELEAQVAKPVALPGDYLSALKALVTSILTMSSREIAELTGKRHNNVTADIRNMMEQLGEDSLRFQEKPSG